MIQISSKVVIVSEWHPWELFAKDVARMIEQSLSANPQDNILAAAYRGPYRRSLDPRFAYRNGHLWRFVNKYRPLDYALILHDNLVVEEEYREFAKYFPHIDITKKFKDDHVQDKNIKLHYVSRAEIPKKLQEMLLAHLRCWYGKSYVSVDCWSPSMNDVSTYFPPSDYDAIHIELYRPDRMSKQKAVEYIFNLANLLSSYRENLS